MAVGSIIRRCYPFKKRDPEKEHVFWRNHSGKAILTSSVNDADLVADWFYLINVMGKLEDEIPDWLWKFQIVSCVTGTVSWAIVASDGRVLDWIRRAARWPVMAIMYALGFALLPLPHLLAHCLCRCRLARCYVHPAAVALAEEVSLMWGTYFSVIIPRVDDSFAKGFHFPASAIFLLGIFLEDIPQIVVTFMVEDVIGAPGGEISNAAQLNMTLAAIDIAHKLAEAWDRRGDMIKSGDGSLRTLSGHAGCVTSLVVIRRTRFVSSSYDHTAKLWDVARGSRRVVRVFRGHTDCVNGADTIDRPRSVPGWYFQPHLSATRTTARIVTASDDGTCRVFDVKSGSCLRVIEHGSRVMCVTVSPNQDYFVTCSSDKRVRRWSTRPPYGMIGELGALADGVDVPFLKISAAFLDNDRLVLGHWNSETVHICDAVETAVLRSYQTGSDVHCIATMCSDAFLTGLGDCSVKMWSDKSGECTRTFRVREGAIASLAKVDCNHFISGSSESVARLWNVHTGQCLRSWKSGNDGLHAVAYMPKGNVALTGSGKTIKLWAVGDLGDGGAEENDVGAEENDSESAEGGSRTGPGFHTLKSSFHTLKSSPL